ncbi:MAG: DUF4292 domain-containing protein [Dysgonamonadaceae bacterium]|jgi:hypothetical protein|nr:DUF4292 domain-containing protein [Dysgonamonadaceae bacterium]
MKKILFYFLPFILFLCILAACKSVKDTGTAALQPMDKEVRFAQVLQSEIKFSALSASLRLSLQAGEKKAPFSLDAQLRILHNEALQLSLRMPLLGTEAMRVVITPDKVLIIDRVNKQCIEESIAALQAQFPFTFDYYMLEALWTNRLFLNGKTALSADDLPAFKTETNTYAARFSYSDAYKTQYTFTYDHTSRMQSVQAGRKSNEGVECLYTDWGTIANQQTFPMKMQWNLQSEQKTYQLTATFKSVDTDANFSIDRNVPNKYKQVSLPEMLRMIQSLL